MLFTVIEGDRELGRKLLVLLDRSEVVGDDPLGLAPLAAELRRSGIDRAPGPEGLRRGVRAAAATRRRRRGRHRRGVVRGCEARGLAHDLRRCPRALYATPERVPSADEIIVEWPEAAFEQIRPDRDTAVVVLTHDDKFDIPALAVALALAKRSTSARSAAAARRRSAASGSSRPASTRSSSSACEGRPASTSAPRARPRRRSRSSPRRSRSAPAGAAARCARREAGSTSSARAMIWTRAAHRLLRSLAGR